MWLLRLLAETNDLLHCVCLLSKMGELVIIQVFCLVKCFLALVAFEKVLSTVVGRQLVHKGSVVCLWTQFFRICHLK